MESYRLHVKIGTHEFEAEGSAEVVKEQFEIFKELIGSTSAQSLAQEEEPNSITIANSDAESGGNGDITRRQSILFAHDSKRSLVTLRIPRRGKQGVSESILLVLLGYCLLRSEDEVGVTKIKTSLAQSGIKAERIDRQTSSDVDNGLLLKMGRAKGSKYRLTNTGRNKAERLMEETLSQVE